MSGGAQTGGPVAWGSSSSWLGREKKTHLGLNLLCRTLVMLARYGGFTQFGKVTNHLIRKNFSGLLVQPPFISTSAWCIPCTSSHGRPAPGGPRTKGPLLGKQLSLRIRTDPPWHESTPPSQGSGSGSQSVFEGPDSERRKNLTIPASDGTCWQVNISIGALAPAVARLKLPTAGQQKNRG